MSQLELATMDDGVKPKVFSNETPKEAAARGRHLCLAPKRSEGERGEWGEAVDYCQEAPDGTLFVANREYESKVEYCPFCGMMAKKSGR